MLNYSPVSSIIGTGCQYIFLEVPERFYRTIDKNTEVIITDNKGNKVNGNLVSISNYISRAISYWSFDFQAANA